MGCKAILVVKVDAVGVGGAARVGRMGRDGAGNGESLIGVVIWVISTMSFVVVVVVGSGWLSLAAGNSAVVGAVVGAFVGVGVVAAAGVPVVVVVVAVVVVAVVVVVVTFAFFSSPPAKRECDVNVLCVPNCEKVLSKNDNEPV